MGWKEDEKRKTGTAVGKTRNDDSCLPRDRKEISHSNPRSKMGKRKRRQKREEEGEVVTEKPVLPQVRPILPLRFAADPGSQKRHYRQRAHANPFSDHVLDYPARPEDVDWAEHFPNHSGDVKPPEFADIGCGFGGLLVALAPLFPESLVLGKNQPLRRCSAPDSSTRA